MSSSLPGYKHLAFKGKRCIRVLDLQPAPNDQAEICCKLREISLDDVPFPIYAALSYCWESQFPNCPVLCSGAALMVTTNCFAALRRLRQTKDLVTLWIDSICIDQTSLEERSNQVALMGEIYTRADRVLIWLGEWDEKVRTAIGIIKDLGTIPDGVIPDDNPESEDEAARQASVAARRKAGDKFRFETYAKVDALKQAAKTSDDDRLGPLFRRPWFSRMWIVQEVVLATAEKVQIYNGDGNDNQLSWLVLMAAVDALQARKYQWGELSKTFELQLNLSLMILMKRFPALKPIYDAKPGDVHSDPSVWQILKQAREKEATDEKDKAFALYGIFQELEIPLPLPDYTKDVEEIYRDAVIAGINNDKALYILYEAASDFRNKHPDLASWVPDLSDPGWRANPGADSRLPVTRNRFCASGPSDPSWRFSDDGRQLHLSAKLMDTIIYCAQPLYIDDWSHLGSGTVDLSRDQQRRDQYRAGLSKVYTTLKSWAETSKWYESYPTGETPAQAFCRTLINDNPDCTDAQQSFPSWYEMIGRSGVEAKMAALASYGIQSGQFPGVSDEAMVQLLEEQLPANSLNDTIAVNAVTGSPHGRYHSLAMSFSNRRSFFLTENSYMGSVPVTIRDNQAINLAKDGDRVALISGLELPMILRPVNENSDEGPFRLVTHAYVHGIMYGEGWEDDSKVVQEIVLL